MMEKDNNNINSLYFSFKGHIKIKYFLKEIKEIYRKTTIIKTNFWKLKKNLK